MNRTARLRNLTVLLALAGSWGAGSASAQVNDNVIWGGVPNQSVLNGLWWDGYNAFSAQARLEPFAGWWDFYIPPIGPDWSTGPYYTVPHWDPYISRPVGWSGLEYSLANAPPESTRPHGWYGFYSPGWRSNPAYAYEFWEYVAPELFAIRQATAAGLGVGSAAGAATEVVLIPERPVFRQYVRNPAPQRGQSPWRAVDGRIAAAPPGLSPAPAPTEPRGFKQYYRQTIPGPNQGRWVLKSAAPAPQR